MPIATPTIVVTQGDGYTDVQFTNSDTATFNYLKRNGVYIGKTIANDGFFLDAHIRAGEQAFYVGSAFDGTQESAPTSPKTAIGRVDSAYIHQVTKGTNRNFIDGTQIQLFNPEGQQTTATREGNILRLAATEKPTIKTAEQTARIIECPVFIPRASRTEIIRAFEEMLWSNDLWCFRDPQGERIFCTIPPQETHTDLDIEMTLVLWESAYQEAI